MVVNKSVLGKKKTISCFAVTGNRNGIIGVNKIIFEFTIYSTFETNNNIKRANLFCKDMDWPKAQWQMAPLNLPKRAPLDHCSSLN
jgi:hypothetical protein